MEILPEESSCFMPTDGKTDMTKLIVAFRNFEYAPKNTSLYNYIPHNRILYPAVNTEVQCQLHSEGRVKWLEYSFADWSSPM